MKYRNIQYSEAHRTNSVTLICTKLLEVSLGFLVRQSRQGCTTVVTGLLGTWTQSLSRKRGHMWKDVEVQNS